MASLFFSQHNGVVSPLPLLIIIFRICFQFPHYPWVWPLIRIAAYIRTTFWGIILSPYTPPWMPAYGLGLFQWRRRRQWRPTLQWHHTSIPSYCCWLPTRQKSFRIIIWQDRADSARRWEHLRDIIFYVYDLKIYFIYAIPFIFRFLVFIVTSSHPVVASLFFSQHNGVVSPLPLLIIIFRICFQFPHYPWVWPLIRIAAYIRTTFWGIILSPYTPPWMPAYGLGLFQWRRRRQWRPTLQWHHTSIPSYCCWLPTRQKSFRIIIWQDRADSARRWEHLRDLTCTSLWPSTVGLSSTLQPLGERGISPINYSGQKKL